MIKLIASDIDGTLLPLGQKQIDPETLDLIDALVDRGVVFCPASGRQLSSLQKLFGPRGSRYAFLCDCGAGAWLNGKSLHTSTMPQALVCELVAELQAIPWCEALLSAADGQLYFFPKSWDIESRDPSFQGSKRNIIRDPRQVPSPVLRVSAFCQTSGKALDDLIGDKWRAKGLQVAVGSPQWLDMTCADKGRGLLGLCRALGIRPEETAAFGDSYNDLPMLRAAGEPWVMDIAVPAIQAQFPGRQCHTVAEVLRRYLAQCQP